MTWKKSNMETRQESRMRMNRQSLLFFYFFIFLFCFAPKVAAAGNPLAVLSKAEGKVRYQRNEFKKWLKGKTGTFLYQGDRVKTDRKSVV